MKHGAKVKRCASEGCTNLSRKGGVCIKHEAKETRCSSDGCTNRAVKGGVCVKHGAKLKRCSSEMELSREEYALNTGQRKSDEHASSTVQRPNDAAVKVG